MLIQQTFALFVFRADRRIRVWGFYKDLKPTGYKKSVNAVESLSVLEA